VVGRLGLAVGGLLLTFSEHGITAIFDAPVRALIGDIRRRLRAGDFDKYVLRVKVGLTFDG
jgi:hypothetical protein